VWSGVWQGSDPAVGQVGGTWEAVFSQAGSTLTGGVTLLGDVDCIDGKASGALDAQSHLSGTLDRSPCPLNQWTLTALDTSAATARGAWTQSNTGASGSLGGQRVARLTGPRVLSISPPVGVPGTVVTIAGESLAPPATNPLSFGGTAQPTLLAASATRWVAPVPSGAATGAVSVVTTAGSAAGPFMFRTEASAPAPVLAWTLSTTGSPAAAVFSRDGRKVFIAERGVPDGAVTVVFRADLIRFFHSSPYNILSFHNSNLTFLN
jgi:hypothetical protein